MAKESAAQRRAVLKYRKEKTHSLVITFPKYDYAKLDAYCKYIGSPVATYVRSVIWKSINADSTFTYNLDSGPDGNQDS